MESREVQKTVRFQVVDLEDRIAPSALFVDAAASVDAHAGVSAGGNGVGLNAGASASASLNAGLSL